MVIISSPTNLAEPGPACEQSTRRSAIRAALTEDADQASWWPKARPIVCQSMSLHATEIGGTQMAPELAYDLLARKDEETQRILDNVIFIEVPSFNPDGQIMVTDWYRKTLDTEYEGSNPPWLYHKYAGHDNNRDAFQTNMVGVAVHGEDSVHRVEAGSLCGPPWHGQLWRAHFSAALCRAGASRWRTRWCGAS